MAMSETTPSEQCPLVAVPFGLPKLTVAFGAHANAASRYGEGQSPASAPVASPDDVTDILAADSCSDQS